MEKKFNCKKFARLRYTYIRNKYIRKGKGASGTYEGKDLFKKAVRYVRRYFKCKNKILNIHFFDPDRYMYEDEACSHLNKAAELFSRSAECGNDMALLHYAFIMLEKCPYPFDKPTPGKYEKQADEALKAMTRAYEYGFALAAYSLAAIYKNGLNHIMPDPEKFEFYSLEYNRLKESDKRQKAISAIRQADGNEWKKIYYIGFLMM